MKCPNCGGNVRVRDTTYTEENEIYRKRSCLNCGHVFYTMEFAIEANDKFLKDWRRCCRTAKPRYEKNPLRTYTIYLKKTDCIIASGTAEECANQMGRSVGAFHSLVSRANRRKTKRYEIYIYDGDEEEMEEE